MKQTLHFILFFSLSLVFSQAKPPKNDSIKKKQAFKVHYLIGVDVLNAGMSLFSDRKLYQFNASANIKKNIYASVDVALDQLKYVKNAYQAEAKGFVLKLGGYYMLMKDRENPYNGFYGGGKLAGSFYMQQYISVPVKGFQTQDSTLGFPSSSQSSYWVEAVIGGRIQLFSTPLYIDVNAQPRYIVYTTKQEAIYPMIVPGFGKSSGKFNMGFSWNIYFLF